MKILYINTTVYDYLTATLVEGLLELGCELRASEATNFAEKIPDHLVKDYAEHADLIIVGSNLGVRSELLLGIRNPRIVFVDGSDYQNLSPPEGLRFKMMFKRELCRRMPDPSAAYVFPLPFAAERRYFAGLAVQRDILVSFVANFAANPLRFSVHQRLANVGHPQVVSGTTGERAYDYPPKPLPIETPMYRQLLYRSLISVNVPGAGYDCARFWEILAARAGLFTFEPDIVIPDGFSDGVDCVSFRSLDEFEDKLQHYLPRQQLAAEIAERGHRRLLAHHTTKARASYFLTVVGRHIGRPGYCQ